MSGFRQFWIIQDVRTGQFLSVNLNWVSSLGRAGRLYDEGEAESTAAWNCSGDEYRIYSFFEPLP